MKPKTPLILFSSLILTIGYLTSVQAVTDAELEALEKQIEQQEADDKKQAEAKRKVEAKRKAEAETKAKRKAEAKNKAEEDAKGLAEIEQKVKEKELKKHQAKQCAPRLLPSDRSLFSNLNSDVFTHVAFENAPAPKVKWAKYKGKSIIESEAAITKSSSNSRMTVESSDGYARKRVFEEKINMNIVFNANSSYNSESQSISTMKDVAVLGGLVPVQFEMVIDGNNSKFTSHSKSEITSVEGILFPLKKDNVLKLIYRNVDNSGLSEDTNIETITEFDNVYTVVDVIDGESLKIGLTCNVFVIEMNTKTKTLGEYKLTSKQTSSYYYSEALGIIVKHVNAAYMGNSHNGVNNESGKELIEYELLPEFKVEKLSAIK